MNKMKVTVTYNGIKYSTNPGQKYLCCGSGNKTIYSRYLHRQIWFDNYGEIPEGFHIHHKDENRFNNDISNLEILPESDHCKLHMAKRVKENPEWFQNRMREARILADKWQGSPAGIEQHKRHAKNFNFGHFDFGERNCDYCGKMYKQKQAVSKYCSNNCKTAARVQSGKDNVQAECKTCGGIFIKNKYRIVKYCDRCKRW